jgi:hypothetical protein
MASVVVGTALIYGVDGTVTNLLVQSYTVTSSFNNEATAQDESGLTVTHRHDDRKSELTVEGIATTDSGQPGLGAEITFSANTASAYTAGSATSDFVGTITKVDDKGSNKNWTMYSITAIVYEGA